MNENKDKQIKFRLTASLKAQVEQYCAAQSITISEFMRIAVQEILKK